jgi:hypothetical protein
MVAQFIDAVVATGAQAVARGHAKTVGIQCVGRNAAGTATAPGACVVVLQASLNGTDFFTVGTWSIAGGQSNGDIVYVVDKPASSWRADVTSLTLGTATEVEIHILGH